MKRIVLSCFVTVISSCLVFAQKPNNDWLSNPKVHDIPAEFAKESAVFILERQVEDYLADDSGNTYISNTVHRIVKVLDDKGIESFNTVTISNNGIEVSNIKSRVILPSGKVIETPKEKILESKSENNVQQYVFALDGLEKGAEVELQYTIKYPVSLFGTEYFQFGIPVLRAEFELKSPNYLIFETKGYNGFPTAKDSVNADTSSKFVRIYTSVMDNIPALKDEESSNYYANIMRIEFRVSYLPISKPNQRQFTWNDLARNIYDNNYKFSDKEIKIVQKYLKSIGVDEKDKELLKIQKIEDAMKKGINISTDVDNDNAAFDVIVTKKLTNDFGFKRFFAACLSEAGVVHELGITSNRYKHVLDEKFENWKPLDYFLFYFPEQKMYLAPTSEMSRMPFIPNAFLYNKAVFSKITTLGNIKTAMASIRTITPTARELSYHNLDATVTFKGDDYTPEIKQTQSLGGYSAMGLREAFLYVPQEQEKELVSKIVDIAATKDDITNYSIQNKELNSYYENKPLLIQATVNAPKLMEKAGPKYLFKVGDVLGRQSEMYQEEKRKMPIETSFPHGLKRKIIVEIPEGYKVTNPEITNINIVHKDDKKNEITMGFTSSYTITGNTMTIDVNEFYELMILPISEYTEFARVINAAADFNKLVLVLEKK